MSADLPAPGRALAIGAHPDDVELGAGATLAKWAAAGSEVHLLILTDGSKGSWERGVDVQALVEARKREAQEAGGQLGAVDIHFLNEVDGELDSRVATRAGVCRVIRRTRPDVVLGHDPWKRYRLHPDHRHAGFLTVDGVVAARDALFHPEPDLDPHRPSILLLFEAEAPDHVEDVEGFLERKVAALLAHRSQWRSTMGIDDHAGGDHRTEQREAFEERILDAARRAARDVAVAARGAGGAGGPERAEGPDVGEAFKRIDDL